MSGKFYIERDDGSLAEYRLRPMTKEQVTGEPTKKEKVASRCEREWWSMFKKYIPCRKKS